MCMTPYDADLLVDALNHVVVAAEDFCCDDNNADADAKDDDHNDNRDEDLLVDALEHVVVATGDCLDVDCEDDDDGDGDNDHYGENNDMMKTFSLTH